MINDKSEQDNSPVGEVRTVEAARGQGNQGKLGRLQNYTFAQLTELAAEPGRADIDVEAYHALPKARTKAFKDAPLTRADLKEADPFISFGAYASSTRDLANLKYRSALTLDFDQDVAACLRRLRMGAISVPFAFVWHTTRSHTHSEPRFRVIVPLARDVLAQEYTALTQTVARLFDVPADAVSSRPAQMMYLPVVNRGGDYLYGKEPGDGYLNPDYYLSDEDTEPQRALTKVNGTHTGRVDVLVNATPPHGIERERGRAALFKLDPDCDEPQWFRYLCAWKHEYGQGEHAEWAYDTALEWSEQAESRFEDEAFEDRWARAVVNPAGGQKPVTILTILEDAKASDYTARQDIIKKYKLRLETEVDAQEVEEGWPNKIRAEESLTKLDRKKLARVLQAAYLRVVKSGPLTLPDAMLMLSPEKATAGSTLKAKYPRTEFGNTQRLHDRFGRHLMYTAEDDAWYRWDNTHWHRAPAAEVKMLAKVTVEDMLRDTDGLLPAEIGEHLEWCKDSQRAFMVNNMVSLLPGWGDTLVPYCELDNDPMMLGVGNGAIDLALGVLNKATRADLITITTPVKFKENAKCPLFEKVVSDAFFGDEQMIDWFQRLIGYSLMGNPKEDIIVIPYGGGSNGKSTILGAIQAVLGGHAKGTPNATFMTDGRGFGSAGSGPNEALLRLRASRFVYMSEPESGAQLRTSLVKSVTGGDVITARGVHAKHSVEFRPTWVVFMPTNHKPTIKDDDNGIWRRIKLVPFTRNFKDPDNGVPEDTDLADKLKGEYEGILGWCVSGAIAYQERGLGDDPQRVREAHVAYRTEQDLLGPWLEDCWKLDPNGRVASGELWDSWKEYAVRTGVIDLVKSQRALTRKLEEKGFLPFRTMVMRGFEGIARLSEPGESDVSLASSQGF